MRRGWCSAACTTTQSRSGTTTSSSGRPSHSPPTRSGFFWLGPWLRESPAGLLMLCDAHKKAHQAAVDNRLTIVMLTDSLASQALRVNGETCKNVRVEEGKLGTNDNNFENTLLQDPEVSRLWNHQHKHCSTTRPQNDDQSHDCQHSNKALTIASDKLHPSLVVIREHQVLM